MGRDFAVPATSTNFDGSDSQNYTLYLRDYIDWSKLLDPVNVKTGKAGFSLPFFDHQFKSIVKFHFDYDGSNMESDTLGYGWSIPNNFIILDSHESIFEEDETFIWVINDVLCKLRFNTELSDNDVRIYRLTDDAAIEGELQKNVEILFYSHANNWEIKIGSDLKLFYGKNDNYGAVANQLVWKNWSSYDMPNQVQRSYMWYLSFVEEKNYPIFLKYKVSTEPSSHMSSAYSYTVGVYLESISRGANVVTFFYEKKNDHEYERFSSNDTNINSWLMKSHYLVRYSYEGKSRRQEVHFRYEMQGGLRLLTKIEQTSDYIAKPIFQFAYFRAEIRKYLMNGIILPSEAQLVFSYSNDKMQSDPNDEIIVPSDYKINYGQDFILISYIKHERYVVLRLFNNDMTEEMYSSENVTPVKSHWPRLGDVRNILPSYEIQICYSIIAIVLNYSDKKLIHFITKHSQGGNWQLEKNHIQSNRKTILLNGPNYFLISDPNSKITLAEWNEHDGKWMRQELIKNNERLATSIALYKNNFAIYNDQHLYFGYKNSIDHQWHLKKLIYQPGFLSATLNTLKLFDLDSSLDSVYDEFERNTLKMNNNLIVLSAFIFDDRRKEFVTRISAFLIGRDHYISETMVTTVRQDRLSDITVMQSGEGDNIVLHYVYADGLFKIQLKSIRKESESKKDDFAAHIKQNFNSPAKLFLINFKNYYIALKGGNMFFCRNLEYDFDGIKWNINRPKISNDNDSIRLSENFHLNKTNSESNVKLLYKNGTIEKVLYDFEVKDFNEIHNYFPYYLATQVNERLIKLIEFNNDMVITGRKIFEEKISPFSYQFWLVTQSDYYSTNRDYTEKLFANSKSLNFRPHSGIKRLFPNHVIVQMIIQMPDNSGNFVQRLTGYNYNSTTAILCYNFIVYKNAIIIPGNDLANGYVDVYDNFRLIVNKNDEIVKYQQSNPIDRNDQVVQPESDKSKILYDKDNRFEIANMKPFNVSSEIVSFYGFEDYERVPKTWSFNRTNIERGKFPLTGKNYLHLNNDFLIGNFQPSHRYSNEIVASCWIRIPIADLPEIGSVVPYLMASVSTTNGDCVISELGVVKLTIDDWSYLEVTIDLFLLYHNNEARNMTESGELKITIIIGSTANKWIDVDNVRLGPLLSIFDVNVYDLESNDQPVAIIKTSGAIIRNHFDKYGARIARINQWNQIEEFITYTKDSLNDSFATNPKSRIELRPQRGFFESFSPIAFHRRWVVSNATSWSVSFGILEHLSMNLDDLSLTSDDIESESFAIRFLYHLERYSSLGLLGNGVLSLMNVSEYAIIELRTSNEVSMFQIPKSGELLLVKESDRIIVWIDGSQYIDQSVDSTNPLKFIFKGKVQIKNVLLLSGNQVTVTYKNALGENIQKISMISENRTIVNALLYDELGRQTISTQPVYVERLPHEPLLAYDPDFVINDNPLAEDSVWSIGYLKGNITELIGHEYCFSETNYDNSPLIRLGRPGQLFSVHGPYATEFSESSTNAFIQKHWPMEMNFTHHTTYRPSGVEVILVFNERNKRVASLVHIPGYSQLLSTYEYNNKSMLIKSLSPMYYMQIDDYIETNKNLSQINEEHFHLQKLLATNITYNANDDIVSKITSDEGLIENLYDQEGLLRFTIQYSRTSVDEIESIVYFKYDIWNRLKSTGLLKSNTIPKIELLNYNITNANSDEFQDFYHSDSETNPLLRGKIQRTITHSHNEPLIEESRCDSQGNRIFKSYIIPSAAPANDKWLTFSIHNRYEGGLLKEVTYPRFGQFDSFRLLYGYDQLKRLISIGIPGQPTHFLSVTYNANHQIAKEVISANSIMELTREYKYNEPGYLIEIADPFLQEDISYTEKTYGNQWYGDGTVTHTKFTAKWHPNVIDIDKISLKDYQFESYFITKELAQKCFEALKTANYIDDNNQQIRILYGELDNDLPLDCTDGIIGRQIAQTLGTHGFPKQYGFRYDYGNHMELTKAKYFLIDSDQDIGPLQPDSFAKEIPTINETTSHDIWNRLHDAHYIVINNPKMNISWAHGKIGRSFVGEHLYHDLDMYSFLENPIRKLLINSIMKRREHLTQSEFEHFFGKWLGNISFAYYNVTAIYNRLNGKGYFENNFTKAIDADFRDVLETFSKYIPDIIGVLHKHFAMALGEAEFDMESYDIDANGNHKKFYSSFERYHMKYTEYTNQIKEIDHLYFGEAQILQTFQMRHDSRGNVVQALHKDIQFMKYHPISNRLMKVIKSDGSCVTFHYDSVGERSMKIVKNSKDEKIMQREYLRDDRGRALVERQIIYSEKPINILTTYYIYGPKSMIGFVRGKQFYSVLTDHQGSVRLVLLNDEVVAAYDYMPYGGLIRKYEKNVQSQIAYRYTGQEWDDEIGLYNYHARFYDPAIGRFYQIDPKSQYFSPYKYAGNSPITMTDPSGKWALNFALGLISAYLEAAAANESFNPFDWKWNADTYIALAAGFVSGVFMRPAFTTTVKVFTKIGFKVKAATRLVHTLGAVFAYVAASSANDSPDPINWEMTAPKTWNALFYGYSIAIESIGMIQLIKKSLSLVTIAASTTIFSLLGILVLYERPELYKTLIDHFMKMPQSATINIDRATFNVAGIVAATIPTTLHLSESPVDYKTKSTSYHLLSIIEENKEIVSTDKVAKTLITSNVRIEMVQKFFDQIKNDLRNISHQISQSGRGVRRAVITKANGSLAYISNQHSNIILFYEIDMLRSPKIIELSKGVNNNTIDPIQMHRQIEYLQNFAKDENYRQFHDQNRDALKNIAQTSWISEKNTEKFLQSLEEDLKESGYISRNILQRRSTQLIFPISEMNIVYQQDRLRRLNTDKKQLQERYNQVVQKMQSLKPKQSDELQNLNNERELIIGAYKIRSQHEEQTKSDLENAYKKITDIQSEIEKSFWNEIKDYVYGMIIFNSMDMIVDTDAHSNEMDIFFSEPSSNASDVEKKCNSCLVSIENVNYLIVNKYWQKYIQNKFQQFGKLETSQNPSDRNFLRPIQIPMNEGEIKDQIETRNRRSIENIFIENKPRKTDSNWYSYKGISNLFQQSNEHQNSTSTANLLDFGDRFLSNLTTTENLLFFDLILSKIFKRKMYKSHSDQRFNLAKQYEVAFEMVDLYEKSLMSATESAGIARNRLNHTNSNSIALQKDILDILMKSKFDELPNLMLTYALQALPSSDRSSPGRLSHRKIENFKKHFHQLNLGRQINEILIQANEV